MSVTKPVTAIAVLLLAAGAQPAASQRPGSRPFPLRGSSSLTFQSPSMGDRYAVNISVPRGVRAGSGRQYPAIVTTDGDWAFFAVNEAASGVMQQGAIDTLIVISIGTGVEDGDSVWSRRRVYEFSPPDWDLKDPFGQVVAQACQTFRMAPGRCTGGAPKFLNVIVNELLPMVMAQYPIDPNQLGLFGVSAGGFFASWAIFQPNSPFKRYLISSPAMAYGNDDVFRQEARYAADHKDLPVKIYLGAGSLEIEDRFFEGTGKIVSGMVHLAGVLGGRGYPGLSVTTEIHPGLSHVDVVGTVVARGLRVLYGK